MRRLHCLTVLLLAAALAAPAWSGTVYAPLIVDRDVDGNRFTTEVRATNGSAEVQTLSYLYIDAQADGTLPDRSLESVTVEILPHATVVLTELVPAGSVGFLEVTTGDEVAVSSRLVGTSVEGEKRFGTDIPVISSANMVPAKGSVILQGWSKDGSQEVTDFFLLNLSHVQNVCDVSIHRRSGTLVIQQTLTLPPLGLRPYPDILGLLGFDKKGEIRARVTCDRRFHAYAVIADLTTAELIYAPPSAFGSSTLSPPSQGPRPDVACPPGAWFERAGAFHRPKVHQEVRFFELPLAAGRYARITVDLDVTPGNWARPADGNHNVFWLHRSTRWAGNVFGYVNIFGPDKDFAKISSNADLPSQNIWAFTKSTTFSKGEKYHVRYTFDADLRRMEAVFTTKTGTPQETEVARVEGTAPTGRIVADGDSFFIYFGHPTGLDGPEVPTYGWLYSNLCVQIE